MADTRDTYLAWLRDAHAMEEQALTMMRGMLSRLENYADLRARIERHVEETERHVSSLDQLLEGCGSGGSMMKDAMGRITATGQAVSGIFTSDEVVKGGMASYTFEHMEIAAYKVLIAAARQLDDQAAVDVFETILAEEEAMADWLLDHLEPTTRTFLEREAAELQSGR